ncbi:unnamed protein product [Closterium sp. NIES-53]
MSLVAPNLQPLAPHVFRRSLRALPPSALRGRPLTFPPSYARGSSSRLAHFLSPRAELSTAPVSAEAAPAGESADGTRAEAEELRSSGAGESGKTPRAGTLTRDRAITRAKNPCFTGMLFRAAPDSRPNALIPPCASPPPPPPYRTTGVLGGRGVRRTTAEQHGVGCAVLQPSSTEVGAGTMNPATFLRVLGPEAWRVAYVEPSMRPDDSRFGDNPNRVQRHTQFQVGWGALRRSQVLSGALRCSQVLSAAPCWPLLHAHTSLHCLPGHSPCALHCLPGHSPCALHCPPHPPPFCACRAGPRGVASGVRGALHSPRRRGWDNPNRVQRHTYQTQAMHKPAPQVYLGSLAALVIDSKQHGVLIPPTPTALHRTDHDVPFVEDNWDRQHDVRFVEDNWESPVLGAWGLGWEVWLDGMEITQFTYFQQVQCGAVRLGWVGGGRESGWNGCGGQLGVARARRVGAGLGGVAGRHGDHPVHLLPVQQVQCGWDGCECAQLWVDTREKLDFPLGRADADVAQPTGDTWPSADVAAQDGAASAGGEEAGEGKGRILVVEIGTEELPPDDVSSAVAQVGALGLVASSHPVSAHSPTTAVRISARGGLTQEGGVDSHHHSTSLSHSPPSLCQLQAAIPPLLARLRLPYESVRVEGTPRRVAVQVGGLAAWQQREQREVRGPPANKAFDKDGKPTKDAKKRMSRNESPLLLPTQALEGFCKRNAVTAEAVTTRADDKGVEYVWASVSEESRPAWAVLGEQLPAVIAGIAFPKTMRWNSQVGVQLAGGHAETA